MATLYLTEQQTLVKKDGDTLVVHIPENKETGTAKRKVRVPLIKIERVVVQGNSTLTSPAIAALMEQHAEVTFLNRYGRFQGHLAPTFSKTANFASPKPPPTTIPSSTTTSPRHSSAANCKTCAPCSCVPTANAKTTTSQRPLPPSSKSSKT
ncbi:MAG: CRISPR-associated endonuclease Cas1 [Chloroflexi bacterium]|nr:CRISPR-associated endonuclease Cas1 [Chloroflexota bacterium]